MEITHKQLEVMVLLSGSRLTMNISRVLIKSFLDASVLQPVD